jgi:hypothetical protein
MLSFQLCLVIKLSNHINDSPQHLARSRFVRLYNLPGVGPLLYLYKDKFGGLLPFPVEAWGFWSQYLANFRWERGGEVPPRRRAGDDIPTTEVSRIYDIVNEICDHQGKSRFVAKYTDFPRITYLTQAFPDAKFIHVVGDGRAVANSWYQMMQRGKMLAWAERDWWIRGWPCNWREEFKGEAYTPLGFVAYQWKFLIDQIWLDAVSLPSDQYLEVHYKELMTDPRSTMEHLLHLGAFHSSKFF